MASQLDVYNLALDIVGESPASSLTDTTKAVGLLNRKWDYAIDEVLREFTWNFARKSVELEYTAGYGIYSTSDEKDITAITQSDPAVVTIASHGWQTDYLIKIDDVVGMTELNQRIFKIELVTTDTFRLPDIDSSFYAAYISGGKAIRYEADPDFQNGYTYDLPDDYLCDPQLEGYPGNNFEIIGWDDGTKKTQRLLTNTDGAILHYTALMADVSQFPNHFISALAATLARMIYRSLAKKGARNFQEIWSECLAIVAKAKLSDTGETKIKEGNYKDPFLDAGGFE
jgi:hypothetical protein